GPEGFVKNQYRKFNMKSQEFGGDDFAMMKAMIGRRFARMLAERCDEEPSPLAEEGWEGVRSEQSASSEAALNLDHPPPPASSPQGEGGEVTDGGVDFSKESDEPERETKFGAWPDLVLIDGGEGQLNAALEALDELGLKNRIIIAAIAK